MNRIEELREEIIDAARAMRTAVRIQSDADQRLSDSVNLGIKYLEYERISFTSLKSMTTARKRIYAAVDELNFLEQA
jgi:hypothetical protein